MNAEDAEQFVRLKERMPSFSYSQIRRAALRLGATLLEIESAALAMAERAPTERRAWLKTKIEK